MGWRFWICRSAPLPNKLEHGKPRVIHFTMDICLPSVAYYSIIIHWLLLITTDPWSWQSHTSLSLLYSKQHWLQAALIFSPLSLGNNATKEYIQSKLESKNPKTLRQFFIPALTTRVAASMTIVATPSVVMSTNADACMPVMSGATPSTNAYINDLSNKPDNEEEGNQKPAALPTSSTCIGIMGRRMIATMMIGSRRPVSNTRIRSQSPTMTQAIVHLLHLLSSTAANGSNASHPSIRKI